MQKHSIHPPGSLMAALLLQVPLQYLFGPLDQVPVFMHRRCNSVSSFLAAPSLMDSLSLSGSGLGLYQPGHHGAHQPLSWLVCSLPTKSCINHNFSQWHWLHLPQNIQWVYGSIHRHKWEVAYVCCNKLTVCFYVTDVHPPVVSFSIGVQIHCRMEQHCGMLLSSGATWLVLL